MSIWNKIIVLIIVSPNWRCSRLFIFVFSLISVEP